MKKRLMGKSLEVVLRFRFNGSHTGERHLSIYDSDKNQIADAWAGTWTGALRKCASNVIAYLRKINKEGVENECDL